MIGDVLADLRTALADADPRSAAHFVPPYRSIAIVPGSPRARRISLLVFAGDRARPFLHVKRTRDAAEAESFAREHDVLRRLSEIDALAGTVARPVALLDTADGTVLAQTCLPGTPMQTALLRRRRAAPRRVRRQVGRALDWLAKTPLRHGDFWPGNILLTRDGIGVVDWEDAGGPHPTDDAFLFLATYAHGVFGVVRRRDPRSAVWEGLLSERWVAQELRSGLATYLRAVSLAPADAHPLFVGFLERAAGLDKDHLGVDPRKLWIPLLADYRALGPDRDLRALMARASR